MVEATLSQIVTILKDAENHHNWVFLSKSAKIVDVTDDFNWKYYSYTDVPWPASNRDYYTNAILKQNDIDYTVTISSKAIPDFAPKLNDCVRIQYIESLWTLNPIGNGSVFIKFELAIDPGGNIPAWIVNLAVTKGPFSTMNGLIKELNKNYNNNIKLDYIKELTLTN